MNQNFDYEDISDKVMNRYDQSDAFSKRFVIFCENAMEGKAEDSDLERLIENVSLNQDEETYEA
jgi:hypothetical protein